jgi:RNA polymerase sigma-70 factor (ECF subfamily)
MAEKHLGQFEADILPHLDDAYTLARYLVGDEHDAQDVVQDAALRAFRHFGGFRQGDPRAWLLSIVRNCCYTLLGARRTDRARMADHGLAIDVADPHAADELATQSSDRALLETALSQLPLELREVLVLRELGDLSYREISDVVGAPMGTVMSRLSRARERLARLLGARVEEAS